MTTAAYSAHPVLAPVAEAVLPVMAVLAILLPALAWRKGRLVEPRLFYTCALVSVVLLYLVRFVIHLLVAHAVYDPHFTFSSHTGFGVTMGVMLAMFRRWLAPVVLVVLAGYFWTIVFLRYHEPKDILFTAVTILLLCNFCYLPWKAKCWQAANSSNSTGTR